jgi:hypothetical protein
MPAFRLLAVLVPRNAPVLLNALAFLSLAALTPVAAYAAPAPVVVGGILIHTIRTSWAGHSPQQRADEVQQRLNAALGQGPIHPRDITVAKVQDDWCVLFRGRRLLTADALAAKQQHSAPATLADQWAARLRQVLPDLTRPQ